MIQKKLLMNTNSGRRWDQDEADDQAPIRLNLAVDSDLDAFFESGDIKRSLR
jgi:hypothetical protein